MKSFGKVVVTVVEAVALVPVFVGGEARFGSKGLAVFVPLTPIATTTNSAAPERLTVIRSAVKADVEVAYQDSILTLVPRAANCLRE